MHARMYCIDSMCMDVYVPSVYKYTVNTLWRCISAADFPSGWISFSTHPAGQWTQLPPANQSPPNSTSLGVCAACARLPLSVH